MTQNVDNENPLAKYVLSSSGPRPEEPSFVRAAGYLPRLEIREPNGISRSLPYSALDFIHFDPETALTLVFSHCSVELRGQNLRALFDALQEHSVRAILVLPDHPVSDTPITVVTTSKLRTDGQVP